MGNCINTPFALSDKKVRLDEEDHQGKMSSGPVYGHSNGPMTLAALLKQQHNLKVGDGKTVKIVVNKKQLQLLMKSMEELKLRHMVIQSMRNRGRKWRPCLATIPEL